MNWKKTLVGVLLVLCTLSLVEGLDCPKDCSGRGRCNSNTGECICNNGFYGEDCADTLDQFLGPVWTGLIVYVCLGSGIILVLTIVVFVLQRKLTTNYGNIMSFFNSKHLILMTCGIISLDQLLVFSISPASLNKKMPFWLYRQLFGLVFICLGFLFLFKIFSWAEFLSTTTQTLKKEENYRKANSKYKGKEHTLEDMVDETKKMRNYRIPFFITIGVIACFQIIRESLITRKLITTQHWMQQVWLMLYMVLFVSITIGFFVLAPRIRNQLPDRMKKKMARITRDTYISCVAFSVLWIVVAILMWKPGVTPEAYATGEFVFRTEIMLMLLYQLSTFVEFTKQFPFVSMIHTGDTSASSEHTGPDTIDSNVEMHIQVQS